MVRASTQDVQQRRDDANLGLVLPEARAEPEEGIEGVTIEPSVRARVEAAKEPITACAMLRA